MSRFLALWFFALFWVILPQSSSTVLGRQERLAESTVGMPRAIEQLVIPGAEVEPIPREDRETPVIVRFVESYRHGSGFRYNIEFYALEPGTYDLRDYIRRKDGSSLEGLEPIAIRVDPILPEGQIEPNSLIAQETPRPWGYRAFLIGGTVVWILVLGWLLFGGPSRRRSSQGAAADRPLTLAERLRPMVEAAIENNLDPAGLAELERLILGYWRRKLGLESLPPAEAAAILRTHEDAGPVVRQLEDWLHKPPGTAGQAINVTELLMPYRDIPADALDTETTLVPSHAGKRV